MGIFLNNHELDLGDELIDSLNERIGDQHLRATKERESPALAETLTNPLDTKACLKLLQFDVLTTLSLTILVYLHSFSCCCIRNLQNPEKFSEISNL